MAFTQKRNIEDFSISQFGRNNDGEQAELVVSPPSDCMDFFTIDELIAGIAKGSKDLGDNYEVFASKEGHIFIRPSENQQCVLRGWQIPSSGKFELRVFSNPEPKETDLVLDSSNWLVMIRGELQTKLLSFDTSAVEADQIAEALANNLSKAKNIAFESGPRGIRVALVDC
jgi:hypothetical protein